MISLIICNTCHSWIYLTYSVHLLIARVERVRDLVLGDLWPCELPLSSLPASDSSTSTLSSWPFGQPILVVQGAEGRLHFLLAEVGGIRVVLFRNRQLSLWGFEIYVTCRDALRTITLDVSYRTFFKKIVVRSTENVLSSISWLLFYSRLLPLSHCVCGHQYGGVTNDQTYIVFQI